MEQHHSTWSVIAVHYIWKITRRLFDICSSAASYQQLCSIWIEIKSLIYSIAFYILRHELLRLLRGYLQSQYTYSPNKLWLFSPMVILSLLCSWCWSSGWVFGGEGIWEVLKNWLIRCHPFCQRLLQAVEDSCARGLRRSMWTAPCLAPLLMESGKAKARISLLREGASHACLNKGVQQSDGNARWYTKSLHTL